MKDIAEAKRRAKEFAETSTIHGVAELGSKRTFDFWAWVILMTLVLVITAIQLADIAQDIRQDKKTSTFDTIDGMEVPLIEFLHSNEKSKCSTLLKPGNATGDALADAILTLAMETCVTRSFFNDICGAHWNGSSDKVWADQLLTDFGIETKDEKDISVAVEKARQWILAAQGQHSDSGDLIKHVFKHFYCRLVSSQVMKFKVYSSTVSEYADSESDDAISVHPLPVYRADNFGWRLNMTGLNIFRGWWSTTTLKGCDVNATYEVVIGSSSHVFKCGEISSVSFRAQLRTYDQRYCDPSLQIPCKIRCAIQQAEKLYSCLPHKGYLPWRSHIPICGLNVLEPEHVTIRQFCKKFCAACHTCRPCRSIVVHSTIQQEDSPWTPFLRQWGEAHVNLNILENQAFEQIHVEPKYSFARSLSAVGGILGIGFGMSILSIIQLLVFCVSLATGSCSRSSRRARPGGQDDRKRRTRRVKARQPHFLRW